MEVYIGTTSYEEFNMLPVQTSTVNTSFITFSFQVTSTPTSEAKAAGIRAEMIPDYGPFF